MPGLMLYDVIHHFIKHFLRSHFYLESCRKWTCGESRIEYYENRPNTLQRPCCGALQVDLYEDPTVLSASHPGRDRS